MKSILFDVDGVFLSEERCFDVSALTVHELLYSEDYLNLKDIKPLHTLTNEDMTSIRNELFEKDQTLNQLKSLGLNSNWDMLFVVFSIHFIQILKTLKDDQIKRYTDSTLFDLETLKHVHQDVNEVTIDHKLPLEFLQTVPSGKENIYTALKDYAKQVLHIEDVALFDIHSPLWHLAQEIYQEWYLGVALFEEIEQKPRKTSFKEGFIYDETFIIPLEEIKALLKRLKDKGYMIAIATGRSRTETIVPFKDAGLLEYFDEHHIVTASEVMKVEAAYPELKPLGKPNPFSYLAALNGNDESQYHAYSTNQENRVSKHDVFIVGDSLADLLSAKKINATFIGPLTGLKGQDAKAELVENGADHIINNVGELERILD
ncbi:HAD family hydrolase [Staphylococcus massiliensis]|uniref:HAD family hydrolase n=1 Tax=Staphylococcus massiliensis S46 TaxID=1229783 RepID=K9AS21_9STAP|nr:HAD hydrolase-like protein [Staphylococcus massiliensis]EKU50233.1 hypothetical protein C273_01275 [Staphylococcus massiliensis S46]MCG3400845.1 HAD hydrolase-like protein [Staphylococcus massiliensis]PNZ99986.1 HAD family hydrolase [Staphylococcus massiliensis CCUG 55927]